MGNYIADFFANIAIIFPAFLLALSFHEFSHALVANLLGDSTAKNQGRLTLNPLAHIDPLGTLFLIFLRIGWAKPVPFDLKNFKHPRLYSILTALAGPCANFILAFVSLFCMKIFPMFKFSMPITLTFLQIFEATAYINVMLGIFNLMPLPPLDGSHFIIAILYNRFPKVIVWLYRYSMFILLFIFLIPQTRLLLIRLIVFVFKFIKNLIFSI